MKATCLRKVCQVLFLHTKKEDVLSPLLSAALGAIPVICKALNTDLMPLLM
jgi:hypothetical protein